MVHVNTKDDREGHILLTTTLMYLFSQRLMILELATCVCTYVVHVYKLAMYLPSHIGARVHSTSPVSVTSHICTGTSTVVKYPFTH